MPRRYRTNLPRRRIRKDVLVEHSNFQKSGGGGTVMDKYFGVQIPRNDAMRVKGGWVHREHRFGSRDLDEDGATS